MLLVDDNTLALAASDLSNHLARPHLTQQIVDILSLEALSVIREAQALARRSGVEISLDEIPTDDERSFELMGGSLTELPFVAVHPDLLRLTRPKNLTELAVLSGCSGPGHRRPLSRWIAARNQPELIDYPDERLEPILAETFGVVVFQEQVMQIAMSLGGIPAGEADQMRRALGRKKRDQLRRWQDRFHAGALALGASPATAERVWSDYILEPSDWSTCKAHAVSYATITYQAAWVAANFPAEYLSAREIQEGRREASMS